MRRLLLCLWVMSALVRRRLGRVGTWVVYLLGLVVFLVWLEEGWWFLGIWMVNSEVIWLSSSRYLVYYSSFWSL